MSSNNSENVVLRKKGRPKSVPIKVSLVENNINKIDNKIKIDNKNKTDSYVKSYLVILNITHEDIKLNTINNINNGGAEIHNEEINNKIPFERFYNNNIDVLYKNIPIKLFNEDLSFDNLDTNINSNNYIKNTTNTICPLLKDVNNNEWAKNSPYLCWNCSCSFNGMPIGIPEFVYKDVIHCSGNFCDFPCMLRNMYEIYTKEEFIEKYPIVCYMYQIVHNVDIDKCQLYMAPPKEIMIKFGGTLSEEEYHTYNREKIVDAYKFPFVPSLLQIYNIKISNDYTFNFDKIIKKKKQEVKEKPFIPIDMELFAKAKENLKNLKIKV